MKNRIPQDEIDRELSRIFFREKISENVSPSPSKDSPRKTVVSSNTGNIKVKKTKLLPFFIILASIIFISAIPYFFIRRNNNIKTTETKTEIISLTEPVNTDIPPEKIILSQKEKLAAKKPAPDNLKNINTLYSFEDNLQGWEIPSWAEEKRDHVGIALSQMKDFASNGDHSMELTVKFPGKTWHGAIVEVQHYLSFENFDIIAADIYLPENAPQWLRGKIILTTGEIWDFTEMMRATRLKPGAWTTVFADISETSQDWKKTVMSEDIKNDIRKIAVRIESAKTPYFGPVYIDNIRLGVPSGGENKR